MFGKDRSEDEQTKSSNSGMELKDFVHSTLSQIAEAVYSFTEEFEGDGKATAIPNFKDLNPHIAGERGLIEVSSVYGRNRDGHVDSVHQRKFASTIEFDVAVTVDRETKKSGELEGAAEAKFGLKVISAIAATGSVKGTAEKTALNSTVSRLRFTIPLQYFLPKAISDERRMKEFLATKTENEKLAVTMMSNETRQDLYPGPIESRPVEVGTSTTPSEKFRKSEGSTNNDESGGSAP